MKHVVLNREFGVVRTVTVFGPGRGGTSVIAGCLRALGVCMGTTPHEYKHEWSPIVRAPDDKVDLPATKRSIQQMNACHQLWGWKYPSDVFHIETVTAFLRHPGFIVVTRDLTEIALSSVARQDVPFGISFYEAAYVAKHIAARMRFWPWPILVIPFAEALAQPGSLVEILSAFLGIDPNEATRKQAADFVQPLARGYRPFDATPDQLADFSPPEDNLRDSRILAVDFSKRYSTEYVRHFEGLLGYAKSSTDSFAAKIENAENLKMACEMLNELRNLFKSCGLAQPGINQAQSQKPGAFSAKEWRAAVHQALDGLTTIAQEASEEALRSPGNYNELNRLYRAFQLLIRVRALLEAGVHRLKRNKI